LDIRKKILEKCRELIWERGLKRVTVEVLAKECGISKKTIYKYFESKDEIFSILTDELIDKLKDEVLEIINREKDPVKRLKELLEIPFNTFQNVPNVLLYDIKTYYPEIEERLNETRSSHRDLVVNTFKQGRDDGVFKNIDPLLIFEFFIGAGNRILSTEFILENGFTLDEVLTNYHQMILSGILA
jgi:AcrR family transcriptional regulator